MKVQFQRRDILPSIILVVHTHANTHCKRGINRCKISLYYHAKISRLFYGPDVTRARLVIVQLATAASTLVMLGLHYIMKDLKLNVWHKKKSGAVELYEKWGRE